MIGHDWRYCHALAKDNFSHGIGICSLMHSPFELCLIMRKSLQLPASDKRLSIDRQHHLAGVLGWCQKVVLKLKVSGMEGLPHLA